MLHSASANASTFAAGFARADSDAPVLRMEASAVPVRVSTLGDAALVETKPMQVAMTTTPDFSPALPGRDASVYGSDIAVMAMGLVGAWMVLIGIAMLARHARLLRIEQNQL